MSDESPIDLQAQADEASAEAIHKAKNAQAAVELAREAQLAKAMEEAVQRTKDALLEGLKEVFGDSDSEDPTRMKVLVRRIPILCTNIEQMHLDIGEIKKTIDSNKKSTDDNSWLLRQIMLGIGTLFIGLLLALFTKII